MSHLALSQIYIRIIAVKGLSRSQPMLKKVSPSSQLVLCSEIASSTRECNVGVAFSAVSSGQELIFDPSKTTFQWEVSMVDFQKMKSQQPKIKIQLFSRSVEKPDDLMTMGYILIDLRDLANEIKPCWIRIHGVNSGEMQITAKLNMLQRKGLKRPEISTNASTESIQSVINWEGSGTNRVGVIPRFKISISLLEYRNLNILLNSVRSTMKYQIQYMFSGYKFNTDTFTDLNGPRGCKDTFTVSCLLSTLYKKLIETLHPLKVVLVDSEFPDNALAIADIFSIRSSDNESLQVPYTFSEWVIFNYPGSDDSLDHKNKPAIKIVVNISDENLTETHHAISAGLISVEDAEENEYENAEFDEDEDDNSHGDSSRALKGVKFAPSPFKAEIESNSITESTCQNDQNSDKIQFDSKNQNKDKSLVIDDIINGDEYDSNHHFRLSIDARSVVGLRRAANFSVQFAYNFLGSSHPVRTHPKWITANTEARIDGGCASYEFCKLPIHLKTIFLQHAFKLNASSRSSLGDEDLGYVVADLSVLFASKPHSYRCPITNKFFNKLEDYETFRQAMIALHAIGKSSHIPPKIPIVIRTYDSYLPIVMKSSTDVLSHTGAKLRILFVLEDMGVVAQSTSVPIKVGYKMHNAGVYENNMAGEEEAEFLPDDSSNLAMNQSNMHAMSSGIEGFQPADANCTTYNPLNRHHLSEIEKNRIDQLTMEWECWRKIAETQWKDDLREKESQLRRHLEAEALSSLSERNNDLRQAQEEAAKLELRLRAAIDAVDRQKAQLTLKEEQVSIRLAQKTAELQLLQRRVRDEAKVKIEGETRKTASLTSQIADVQLSLERSEKRLKEVEKDYDTYRHQMRSLPETSLREEAAKLRAQLGESRGEVERERRLRSEAELEKEHFRAQMHRLALALKRERERSASIARQELEQLRLEFLAREERYVLDGDREELRTIRHELALLRNAGVRNDQQINNDPSSPDRIYNNSHPNSSRNSFSPSTLINETPISSVNVKRELPIDNRAISRLTGKLSEVLSSGLYNEDSDPLISELNRAIDYEINSK